MPWGLSTAASSSAAHGFASGRSKRAPTCFRRGIEMARLTLEQERARLASLSVFEQEYAAFAPIAGIDEAGRGPLAGPVAAAAVILDPAQEILYINDSKKLSEARREMLYGEIMEKALSVGVGLVSAARIDEINILQATYEAMRLAVAQLDPVPGILLVDAVTIPQVTVRQVPIIKGDAKSLSIGAASIIAKVTRDRILKDMDRTYPEYGFAQHKGYGTAAHIEAIRKFGPCPEHRRSFIRNFIS
ncbi:MAG: ribonuclease HII [Lachnospiraceae bacterium]|nr:ribonuclease HII [Lachnospiraceae bacterium]